MIGFVVQYFPGSLELIVNFWGVFLLFMRSLVVEK